MEALSCPIACDSFAITSVATRNVSLLHRVRASCSTQSHTWSKSRRLGLSGHTAGVPHLRLVLSSSNLWGHACARKCGRTAHHDESSPGNISRSAYLRADAIRADSVL